MVEHLRRGPRTGGAHVACWQRRVGDAQNHRRKRSRGLSRSADPRQARTGTLGLDDPLSIRNQFRSIVDGSPYALSEGDDSDKAIYAAVGRTLTLRELCEAMITASSNFASNLLIEKLGADRIQRTVSALGADGMRVLRGVEDQKAFDKGLNNTTTARGLLVLLDKLAHGRAVDALADAEMVAIL